MINPEGYIYLIKTVGRIYKVGRSKTPELRLKTLQRSNPHKLELVHTIHTPDMVEWEAYFHFVYEDYRVHGEWFVLPKQQVGLFMRFPAEVYFMPQDDEMLGWIAPYRYDNYLRPITPRLPDGRILVAD